MGGTASYASLTAKAFGLKVGLITSWGNDMSLGPMNEVTVINKPSKSSTTFENIYIENQRNQVLHSLAELLDINLIPETWLNTPIVHIGPIADEIHPNIIEGFSNSFIGITPQGWMRTWDENGWISPIEWQSYSTVLDKSQAVIISREDVLANEAIVEDWAASCPVLVVTEGYLGCRVFWHGDVRRFNVPKEEETDPTGAGDIFATAFFIQFHKTGDPWEAARFANQLAAQSVTRVGIEGIPHEREIMKAKSEVL
jgi:sugar/nucleoside kinase (ribokinase family)